MPPRGRKTATKKTGGELNIKSLKDIERERSRIKKARMDTRKTLREGLSAKLDEVRNKLADKIDQELKTVSHSRDVAIKQLSEAFEHEEQKKKELVDLADHIQLQSNNLVLKMQAVFQAKAQRLSNHRRSLNKDKHA